MPTIAEAPTQEDPPPQAPTRKRRDLLASLRHEPSGRTAFLWLLGIAALSALIRAALVTRVHAPTVFSDEMGYEKLALSIGRDGRVALFNEEGFSYLPLYSVVLSPIYALGASAPTAYFLIKIVNAFLISLSLFPAYKIARFVLPRRLSLLVAGLSALAPLMLYSSFTLSENLAYPVSLLATWAMLESVRAPSVRTDAMLIGATILATAVRIQLIVLVPAAVTAILFAAIVGRGRDDVFASLSRAVKQHVLLVGALGAGLLAAGAVALSGRDVLSAAGRYADVGRNGFPDVSDFLELAVRHLAGLDLAVGVVPFVGALLAAFVFFGSRSRARPEHVAFAAVALGLTVWLLLEIAFDAAIFDAAGDLPRIHERFLIYVIPLFLVALFAVYRLPDSRLPVRAYFVAAAIAAALPAVIPFHTVINNTVGVDSFALHPFSHVSDGRLVARPHATLAAVWLAGTLSLLYVQVRHRLRAIVLLVLIVSIGISLLAKRRIEDGGNFARALLPAHADWIDQAHPAGDVVLVSSVRNPTPDLETAFFNSSISRVYYVCRPALGAEFGERQVTIDKSGRLRGPSGYVNAAYAVGRTRLRLRGRVVARNHEGHLLLVAPSKGRVRIVSAKPAALCKPSRAKR